MHAVQPILHVGCLTVLMQGDERGGAPLLEVLRPLRESRESRGIPADSASPRRRSHASEVSAERDRRAATGECRPDEGTGSVVNVREKIGTIDRQLHASGEPVVLLEDVVHCVF